MEKGSLSHNSTHVFRRSIASKFMLFVMLFNLLPAPAIALDDMPAETPSLDEAALQPPSFQDEFSVLTQTYSAIAEEEDNCSQPFEHGRQERNGNRYQP